MSDARAQVVSRSGMVLPALVIILLAALIVPLPPFVLDLLLTSNLMASVVVLVLAMTVDRPVQFSSFPSILLLLTLFRLSLNIASTRLILLGGAHGEGGAGRVIEAFGSFVTGGEPIVGATVFVALIVIQYVVITHGAVRVSEVIARFTLDAMPGKQMSVDADLSSGAIDDEEAARRRRTIAREAEFAGAMDGAVRFSQRDAIAAIILLTVNVVAGVGLGTLQHGMPILDALERFTLMTIGDGIAAAIPALLVSVAGGIIATRAASEAALGNEVAAQVLRARQPLLMAAAVLATLGLVPGLPKLSFFLLAGTCALLGWKLGQGAAPRADSAAPPARTGAAPDQGPDVVELVRAEPVVVELGLSLLSLADETSGADLRDRVRTVRRQVAQELGVPIPMIRVRDRLDLPGQEYRLKIHEAEVARGALMPRSLLAILPVGDSAAPAGVPASDPTFGLPARWIRPSDREEAAAAGCTVVDPSVVLATHLGHVLRREAWRLVGRKEARDVLETVQAGLAEEVIPKLLPLGSVQQVLRNLLREGVTLRQAPMLVDALMFAAESTKDIDELTARVRVALGPALCATHVDSDGRLPVYALGARLEEQIREAQRQGGVGADLVLDVSEAVRRAISSGPAANQPVLLCSPAVRSGLKRIVDRVLPMAAVLSHAEVPDTVPVLRLGVAQ